MANLYITSAEIFSGKSALCIGLGVRFRADGLKVGYMKPVNVNCHLREGLPYDDDVVFAKEVFAMEEPPTLIGPVALTPAKLEQQIRGPETDFSTRFVDAFTQLSSSRNIMVLEGGRSWREGYVAGLSVKKVVELTWSYVLIVLKYDDTLLADRALAAQDFFGSALIGVMINETPWANLDHVQKAIIPYLVRHDLPVLGVLPKDIMLAAPTVAEIAAGLQAEVLCSPEHVGKLVENMLVGAMSVESALAFFQRKPNKAVITGGDRADIQLAALETSTRCLILTGNLYPSPTVLNRAEELGVPVLLADMDTLKAMQIVESYLGKGRVQLPQKIDRFSALLNEFFNFSALYTSLGIR
jgi:uncharacterized protein